MIIKNKTTNEVVHISYDDRVEVHEDDKFHMCIGGIVERLLRKGFNIGEYAATKQIEPWQIGQ